MEDKDKQEVVNGQTIYCNILYARNPQIAVHVGNFELYQNSVPNKEEEARS